MCVVKEVLIEGAMSPRARATLVRFFANRWILAGKTLSPRSLKKVTGSGALWAGAMKRPCVSAGVRAFVSAFRRW